MHTHSLILTTVVYTVVTEAQPVYLNKLEKSKRKKTHQKTPFILNRLGRGSLSSQRHGIRYFAFLLKLNDRRFAEFLAFIRPVVQWIFTRQWSFVPILSPWNARFSLLLVLGKYSYALGQQPSWRVPPTSGRFHTPVHCACAKISVKGVYS